MEVKFEKKDVEMFSHRADTDTSTQILEYKQQQYVLSSNMNECNSGLQPTTTTTEDTKHLPLQEAEELTELQAD